MENLLLQLVKDASGAKFAEIRNTCQELHDFLEAQQGSVRASPHELRKKCISALQLALASNNTKLIAHSLVGFQKLIRDDRFQSSLECELEEQWLPSQLLLAIGSIKAYSDDVQIELLKVLLNMACTTWWSMNEVVILRILNVCQDAYCTNNAAIKIAAQATASQTLWAFCDHLQKEDKSLKKNPFLHASQSNVEDIDTAFNGLVPIIQYFCRKLQKKPRSSNLKERVIPFYLESLLSLVTVLPETVLKSSLLQDYLWKEFCPTLLSLLGSPKMDKMAVSYSQKVGLQDNQPESTWHSNTFASSPSLMTNECRTVYNIAVELVRLAGSFRSLRPMLESVFHRNLLSTSPSHRLDALKATKEILRKPDRLLKFAGPPLIEDKNDPCLTDLGLLKLAMDTFVECAHCTDKAVCYQSVDCVVSLLDSLEQICDGIGLTAEYVTRINGLYHNLESADYCGPMTYQSWEKLKKLSEEQETFVHYHRESESEKDGIEEHCTKDENQSVNDDDAEIGNRQENQSTILDTEATHDAELDVSRTKNGDVVPLVGVSTASCKELDYGNSNNQEDNLSGYETDSSGATEGPEEGFDEVDEDVEEIICAIQEDQILKRQRIPKSLLSNQNGEAEQERVAKLYETRELYAQQERSNAHHFTDVLRNLLPKLLSIKSSIETDECLQEFASNYCEEVHSGQKTNTENERVLYPMIVNADGVYLATYTALLLNLKLILSNYYDVLDGIPPVTEEQFIDSVHGSGVLVYLSSSWLAELYQQVLACNFLGDAGYDRTSHDNCALINLLTDLEGLKHGHKGAHLLSDYFRLERAGMSGEQAPEVIAGRKFSRRILTGCWNGIVEVLSVLLNGKNAVGISSSLGLMLGTEGAREEHKRARDAIANSLDGLQKAARLSNILSIHSRCEAIFSLLASVSCPEAESPATPKKLKSSLLLGKNRPLKLHASHVLSMDVILSRGLELGSHNPDCWKHVFRCCLYLAELEHSFFSKGLQVTNATQTISPVIDGDKKPNESSDNYNGDNSFPLSTTILHSPLSSVNIPEFVKQNVANLGSAGTLAPDKSLQLLCILSQQADRLFDDAAYKLNLKSLLGFLNALCAVSQKCLFSVPSKRITKLAKNRSVFQTNLSLLHRVGSLMLKCIRSGRPLIHVMQVWSIIGLHLMEAACHHDQDVAKTAVTSIHDIVNALLANQSELPYFHFNEALFKPFENLLCLELCDSDIQDQIISSICEFVEGCTVEIRSGWRPLFGALRAVRPTFKEVVQETDLDEARLNPNHIRAVLDVFEAFLNTDNVLVFANAAVDCILCLLKHIKGDPQDNDFQKLTGSCGNQPQPNLCLASLKYLHKCCSILASMQQMPSCPIFHSSSRIKLGSSLQFIDPEIPGMTFVYFTCDGVIHDIDPNKKFNMDKLDMNMKDNISLETFQNNLLSLEQMELPSGILHVWCLVLEGLVGAIVTSSQNHHSYTIETLFDLLQKVYEIPGAEFGLYIINHLLLPMIQMWLRRTSRIYRGWDNFASHFKQCCGQTTDLIVDYITKLTENNLFDSLPASKLMVYQLLQLLNECVAQPTESISRLGCSCIRHVILTTGPYLKSDMWELICQALRCACKASLFSLKQLMVAFHAGSDNFYGDVGQVKVAAKSDCSPDENERLKQLAQQVFLLDNQRIVSNDLDLDDPVDDDRSYIFLLYPPDAEHSNNPEVLVVKVPFRNLVVGLLSHQILLQILGSILLQGIPRVVPTLANILLQSPAPTPSFPSTSLPGSDVSCRDDTELSHKDKLPGMMKCLSHTQLLTLLNCLEDSYTTACAFDARPGLKFLVQKVAHAKAAANLYKQSGASWTMHLVVLLELCLHYPLREGINYKKDDGRKNTEKEIYFVTKLKNSFTDMCKTYAELFAKKNEDCFDRFRDQPIFFLVAQTDDYMEMRHKNDKVGQLTTLPSSKDEEVSPEFEESTTEALATKSPDDSPDSAHDVAADLSSLPEETCNEKENTQVYNVATQKDIDSVVSEFKRRKQQHAMPSTKLQKKKYSFLSQPNGNQARTERQETKLPSVLKDHEANIKVRTEMILSIFDFFCQLEDYQFKMLLPTVFPFVRTLVVHGKDEMVRQNLAEFLDRIAILFAFQAE